MATVFAAIRKDPDGRLAITCRYAAPRDKEVNVTWISRGERWLGVAYRKWEAHVGQVVDLSKWKGTGEGMIGGPTRARIAAFLDGPLAFVTPFSDPEEIRRGIAEAKAMVDDEDHEYLPSARKQIDDGLRRGRWCLRKALEMRRKFPAIFGQERQDRPSKTKRRRA